MNDLTMFDPAVLNIAIEKQIEINVLKALINLMNTTGYSATTCGIYFARGRWIIDKYPTSMGATTQGRMIKIVREQLLGKLN